MGHAMLRTGFWQRAAASLPSAVRERYGLELQGAERLDFAVQDAVDAYRRAKAAAAHWFQSAVLKPRIDL